MSKNFINNVPRYFEPYVNDCFQNAMASLMLYKGINPKVMLADYLSFMYDKESGYFGMNYLFKPNTTVEFTEEELNTSLEFAYFPVPVYYSDYKEKGMGNLSKDKASIMMFMEKDAQKAYLRLKELIDNDTPVIAAVDLHYIQYHRAYKKDHGLHYVVITGYDEDEGCFELFDKYRLSSSDFDGKLPIDEVNMARQSDNPQRNAVMGEYTRPLMNIWAELKISKDFRITDEGIMAIITESCKRMGGEKVVLGNKCGLQSLESFKDDLLAKKEEALDDRNMYMFKTYYNETFKTIARSRKRYKAFIEELTSLMPVDLINEICNCLENSSKCWDISANLSLKLGITKSMALIDEVAKQLGMVIENESIVVDKLNNYIASR